MTANKLPSKEYLEECFIYCRLKGQLIWKERPLHHFRTVPWWERWNKQYAGSIVGSRCKRGAWRTYICGVKVFNHRIIWRMIHDEEPEMIDHIDHDPSNNRLENLRASDRHTNQFNRTKSRRNKSGYKGVFWDEHNQSWRACIGYKGKYKWLGTFATPEDAYEAYCKAAKELHGAFACTE